MKMNTKLGFEPVTYSEITKDEDFWAGCKSCVNYDVLTGKKKCNCLCTAMLFDPAKAGKTTLPDRPNPEKANEKFTPIYN